LNKFSTKDYKQYKVGDLLLYNEDFFGNARPDGNNNNDTGLIIRVDIGDKKTIFHVEWYKCKNGYGELTEETVHSMKEWNGSYVVPAK
jgi:hypothetical protein